MMKEYLVTFYSHYNAIRLMHLLKPKGFPIALSPVPRGLSSSCGTCARFSTDLDPMALLEKIEFEQLVQIEADGMRVLDDRR